MRKFFFQVIAQTPFVPPNVDTLFLEVAGNAPIAYSISIPDDYSPAKPVPLVLALHFSGDPEGAGRAVLVMLVAQGLDKLGAILIGPDSKGGAWSSAANEQAVNFLIEDVEKRLQLRPEAGCGHRLQYGWYRRLVFWNEISRSIFSRDSDCRYTTRVAGKMAPARFCDSFAR